jgi:hypothetical protein
MKPTELQQEVAKLIADEARFWYHSNDIESPSHSCEIDLSVDNLGLWNNLPKEQIHQLKYMLNDLYWFIRDLK